MNTVCKYISPLALTILAVAAGCVAFGQGPRTQPMDATFVKEAATGGMAEVKMGRLAEQRGTNSAVKAFGKRMVIDHTKAGEQLKSIALRNHFTVPATLDKSDQAEYVRLSGLSGAEFDKAFAQDMVADHGQAIDAFQQEATTGTNSDLESFASETLPTLKDHLKQAKEMQETVTGHDSNQ